MTHELEREFPPLYANEDKEPEDVRIIAKFFNPAGSWTWYATEYDAKTGVFFGLVDGLEKELGYFNLADLQRYRGPLNLGIERDLYFGEHTLDEVMKKML